MMRRKNYIVRTENAGVFWGAILYRNEELRTVKMKARRIWYWEGAFTLSQLALNGTLKPDKCKFPDWVDIELFQVIEIIQTTPAADKSLSKVAIKIE